MILPSICLLSLYTLITIEGLKEIKGINLFKLYCKIDNNVKTVMTEPKLEI
jgi:hypothetical protein